MSLDDGDPVLTGLSLAAVVLGLAWVVLGVRVAVSRRFPAVWIRLARPTPSQRAQPVRMGCAQAMSGAGLVGFGATFLIPMPYPVGVALIAVYLLLLLTAAGSVALLRR
ncbi:MULTISPECIES: hypothetical protein [Micromonospora]|uniref:Uncharacterized protein n=1 Tax=Micromonospora tulbaghiae TaxID=479978 RepID=A0A386WSC5_9ACTN|nr:hypothetical protein [Micromonospora tulbaghiae]AYF30538.1 hypothetical protein CSH63_24460 [Micromonospora tulbaghiae]